MHHRNTKMMESMQFCEGWDSPPLKHAEVLFKQTAKHMLSAGTTSCSGFQWKTLDDSDPRPVLLLFGVAPKNIFFIKHESHLNSYESNLS